MIINKIDHPGSRVLMKRVRIVARKRRGHFTQPVKCRLALGTALLLRKNHARGASETLFHATILATNFNF